MQRFVFEMNKEKILFVMGVIYLEENQMFEVFFEVLEGDFKEIEVFEEVCEFVIENINEVFMCFDMNYDFEFCGDCLDLLFEMWGVSDRVFVIIFLGNFFC